MKVKDVKYSFVMDLMQYSVPFTCSAVMIRKVLTVLSTQDHSGPVYSECEGGGRGGHIVQFFLKTSWYFTNDNVFFGTSHR